MYIKSDRARERKFAKPIASQKATHPQSKLALLFFLTEASSSNEPSPGDRLSNYTRIEAIYGTHLHSKAGHCPSAGRL